VLLIGGAAKNPAVQQIAADFFGKVIHIPPPDEYVANGAAKQAAWALNGTVEAPKWSLGETKEASPVKGSFDFVASNYLELIGSLNS
jgi:xylulokinase